MKVINFVKINLKYKKYLVALHSPHFDYARLDANQFESTGTVKDGASVGPVVALNVNARRIRFREIDSVIALSTQSP